jgi:D-galactarolactone cycloisomerase
MAMKVRDVRCHVVRHELSEPFGFSQWWYDARELCLVEVTTEEGVTGWGEGYGPARVIRAAIEHFFAPLLIGRDVAAPPAVWQALYERSCDYGRKGIMLSAISALDIALWDIEGKAAGEPVCRLLSDSAEAAAQVPAYATGMYFVEREDLPATLAREAAGYVEEGFRGVKMKVGLGQEEDLANVDAVRECIGPEPLLMVDANHAYGPDQAIAMARRLEPYGITWFEEPVSPDDLDGYRRVRREAAMPVAGGECEFTRYGFGPLLRGGCVDIAQPDPCAAGGISEMRHIAALAEECGVPVVFHTWGSAVALAVALHLNAGLLAGRDAGDVAFPWPWIELDRTENPFREELLLQPIGLERGMLSVPQGPGLGIEVARPMVEAYEVV